MEALKNQNVAVKKEFEKQGLKLVNIKFIDDETMVYITRKKKRK